MNRKIEHIRLFLKQNRRIFVFVGIFLFCMIVVTLGYTYSLFTTYVEKEGAFTLIVPELDFLLESEFLDENNRIVVEAGKTRTIEVQVTNVNDIESHFKLYYLGDISEKVMVSYQKNDKYQNGVGALTQSEKVTFLIQIENQTLRNVEITFGVQGGLQNRDLVLKQGEELVETTKKLCLNNPNLPVLVEGQIPVIYNEASSSWVKADITSDWYDYCSQEWANVVTVKPSGTKTRSEYMSASVGTPISMDDINTMWVWIPRFEYMYTNLGDQYAGGTAELPGEISIYFVNGRGTVSRDSENYKVHPAFAFGEDELEGFWYAKFETGGTVSLACTNTSCDVSDVVVKPGVKSLMNLSSGNHFYMSRSMQLNNASIYGFSKTDSDLHMSKNSEWGAVSYLTQSKYGKYGNSNYEGSEKEVRINNCSNGITGIGANKQNESESTSTCTTNTYQTKNGQAASTTGNITGIYDMSGGRYEHVMGVLADHSGKPYSGGSTVSHSGFNGYLGVNQDYKTDGFPFPDSKYYDLYTSSNLNSFDGSLSQQGCNNGVCFGHAMSETGGWYHDYYRYVRNNYPWFIRSGSWANGSNAGIFYLYELSGGSNQTTRLTHVPLK